MKRGLGFTGLGCILAAIAPGCGDDGGRTDAGDCPPGMICLDGGTDGGGPPDTGRPDGGGTDAPVDMCLGLGTTCTPDRGCRVGGCTFEERTTSIGGTMDAILGHPMGTMSIPITVWEDGYCTPAEPTATMPAPCVLGEAGGACGPCGTCVGAGTTAAGEQVTICLLQCDPSLTDNGDCRPNYECSLTIAGCVPGCRPEDGDDQCRIFRDDTNMDGDIDNGPAGDPVGVDRLTYDTMSDGTCDSGTFRCTHTGTAGAEAGDTCVRDSQCEADGACIPGAGWPDGYCTKFGCDLPGNECAGMGRCQDRRIGVSICVEPCMVAQAFQMDMMSTADDWLDGMDPLVRGGCREGYGCNWNGLDGPGVAGNGGCLPGEYNDVMVPNIGATCRDPDGDGPLTASSQCWSPFGLGFCSALGDGTCLLADCGAPGMPPAAALGMATGGTQTVECVDADGTAGDFTVLLRGCPGGPADCRDGTATPTAGEIGLGCLRFPTMTSPPVCIGCTQDTECPTGFECNSPDPMTLGDCVAM